MVSSDMFFLLFISLVGLAACLPSSSFTQARQSASSLVVTRVPDYVRPYIVHAYKLDGYRVGSQIYRFPVTGPSSDYAFTLISTAAPASTELGVLPHVSIRSNGHITNFMADDYIRLMRNIMRTSTASVVAMLYGLAKTTLLQVASSHRAITVLFPTTQRIHFKSWTLLLSLSA